ncbi:hypothetical protein OnM2_061056 [Erysiphe neolycopersici]|uniref:GAG-pre-integrase domain-containing protein n=1 Tax=Erysiphe neolycopersici TaxID=212602 RepID=A0A420HPB7_9PEZI|nr:hypothetical protein OnM2_061056 [Erysiphe neolycopersici]
MQTLRNNFDLYTLDELFSNLLDGANRLQSKIDTNYNVSQEPPINVLILQSADMSSDVINKEENAMLRNVDRVVIPDQALLVSDSISSEQRCSRNELNNVTTVGDKIVDVGVLHNRMGHVGHANLVRLLQNTSGFTKLSNKNNVQLQHCEDCLSKIRYLEVKFLRSKDEAYDAFA